MGPFRRNPLQQPDSEALLRYVSGESPLAESEAIRAWAAENPDRLATIEELKAAWALPPEAPEWDKSGVWDRLSAELAAPKSFSARRPAHAARGWASHHNRKSRWAPVAIAAAVVLTIGISSMSVRSYFARTTVQQPVTYRDVITNRGQQAVLDLADGSRVTLAPASTLSIPSNFDQQGENGRRRDLRLIGRAQFDVAHDVTRPFTVETRSAITEDVGTSFVISAYAHSPSTEVVVADGSVALWEPRKYRAQRASQSRRPLMILEHGDLATLDLKGTATRTRNVSVSSYTSWTNGVLSFNTARLSDVITELERWYDIDLRLGDSSLGDMHVTAQVRTETSRDAVHSLALTLGLKERVNGRVVTLLRPVGEGRGSR